MSNVQLYSQVAAEVSPSLRQVIPETPETETADFADDFVSDALPSAASDAFSAPSPILDYVLRVTGSRPERFSGRHIAMATGWNNTVPRWYEINLYETEDGHIIVDVRLFHKSDDDSDLYHVETLNTWTEAARWLEGYNPANDIVCHVQVDDDRLSAAEVSLSGIALRQTILELRTQFRSLVGDLLYQLKAPLAD